MTVIISLEKECDIENKMEEELHDILSRHTENMLKNKEENK